MLKFLALIGLLAMLAGIGTAVFFFGGFYSVATTAPECSGLRVNCWPT